MILLFFLSLFWAYIHCRDSYSNLVLPKSQPSLARACDRDLIHDDLLRIMDDNSPFKKNPGYLIDRHYPEPSLDRNLKALQYWGQYYLYAYKQEKSAPPGAKAHYASVMDDLADQIAHRFNNMSFNNIMQKDGKNACLTSTPLAQQLRPYYLIFPPNYPLYKQPATLWTILANLRDTRSKIYQHSNEQDYEIEITAE